MASIWQDNFDKGFDQGMEKGIQQGREEGIQQGREEGIQQGREEGIQQGMEKGIQQGREEGMEEKLFEIALFLVKDKGWSIDEALSLSSDSEEVKESVRRRIIECL